MGQGRRHLVEPFTAAGQFQQPVVLTLLLAGQALDHLAQGGQQQRQGDEDHAHAETVGVAQLPGQGVQGGMRRRGAVPQGGQQVSTQRHHQQPERGAAPQGQRAEQQRHQQIERQRVTGAAQLLQQADEDHHVQGQFQGQQALLPAGIEAGQGDQVGQQQRRQPQQRLQAGGGARDLLQHQQGQRQAQYQQAAQADQPAAPDALQG